MKNLWHVWTLINVYQRKMPQHESIISALHRIRHFSMCYPLVRLIYSRIDRTTSQTSRLITTDAVIPIPTIKSRDRKAWS